MYLKNRRRCHTDGTPTVSLATRRKIVTNIMRGSTVPVRMDSYPDVDVPVTVVDERFVAIPTCVL